jgi:ubiquinone biosynthesis protein COQ9
MTAMEPDSPLARIRFQLALAIGDNAAFDGWSETAVDAAADQLGVDRAQARLACPKDALGLIDLYIQGIDRALEAEFPPERIATMKIRARIRDLLWRRFELMRPARESVRRALAILAMPQNVPRATRIGWRSADLMWRVAGDVATDFNHYTKRLTLSAVYASTLLAWLSDDSEDDADTAAFLDRRIDNVMQFEKWKAGLSRDSLRRPSLSRFLGRLRYPPV